MLYHKPGFDKKNTRETKQGMEEDSVDEEFAEWLGERGADHHGGGVIT